MLGKLEAFGARYIMERKHTDSIEIDFQTKEDLNMGQLNLDSIPFFIFTQLLRDENKNNITTESDTRIALFVANCLFREERYWETHELLEDIWHISQGNIRSYFHGLTLLAIAGVQWQTHREEIARSTYLRAVSMLRMSGINRRFVNSLPSGYLYPLQITIPEEILLTE
ncbi:MAG: DUF309 domain-containing protein [Thermoplasmataceae archaeon]